MQQRTILHLEDNLLTAEAIKRYFPQDAVIEHYQRYADAIQALDARGGEYNGFILDFELPDGKGTDFAIEARRRGNDSKIVILSGIEKDDIFKQVQDLRDITILAKPIFSFSEIAAALELV